MGISRGLDFLRRQQANQNRETIYKLWVVSGDTARFWWLVQDVDKDLMAPMIHQLERTVMSGDRKGEKYDVDVLCQRETRDDPLEMCEYCVEGVKGPFHRLIGFVYVDTILHEKLKMNKKTGEPMPWELKKRGNAKIYEETPDPRVRLFIMKTKMAQQVMKKYDEFDTLFDRPYKLEKSGQGPTTLEVLSCPDDAIVVPEEVLEAYANLPSLEETIKAEFGRYSGSNNTPSLGGRGVALPTFKSPEEVEDEDFSGVIDFDLD